MAREAQPGQINYSLVDRWFLGHVAAGAALSLLGVGFGHTMAFAAGWELLERPIKDAAPGLFPHPEQDTPQNILGDLAGNALGWWIAERMRR